MAMAGRITSLLGNHSVKLRNNVTFSVLKSLNAGYASKPAKKAGAVGGKGGATKKKTLEVETDPKLLCTRLCGGNYLKEGQDPVLGPDEDYPDWLWELRIEKGPVPLEELSQDDPKYWRRLKLLTLRQRNRVRYAKRL